MFCRHSPVSFVKLYNNISFPGVNFKLQSDKNERLFKLLKNVKHASRLAHIDTNKPPKYVLLPPKSASSPEWVLVQESFVMLCEEIINLMHNDTFVMHRVKNRWFDVNMIIFLSLVRFGPQPLFKRCQNHAIGGF